ncbi:hypothetical protein GCM10009823_34020 [Brevibacterium salitolerans]|uniref:Transposase n=1 Tax=Brevibacterium salitolerans TaxID=1403566 RepID=A0ABN2XC43_9MICO
MWLQRARVDRGETAPTDAMPTTAQTAQSREASKRIRLREQENEVLRGAAAYLAQAHLPEKALPVRDRARR